MERPRALHRTPTGSVRRNPQVRYPWPVPSLFSRKTASTQAADPEPQAAAVTEAERPGKGDGRDGRDSRDNGSATGKGYTPGKGRATAKRGIAGRRPVEAPPKTRREAYQIGRAS